MTLKHWLIGAVGALTIGTLSASVQAAPLGIAPDNLKATAENTAVQDVVWVERCWWHRGHRHCRRVWRNRPSYYGPSFRFRFDGRDRHRRHHYHHRRHD
jgi:hypothetical protein